MNNKKFKQPFEIIYDKFIEVADKNLHPHSNIGFSKFLGHKHDGKVRAWKAGQWPSAHDCWILHKKLGFSLEWLLTGDDQKMVTDSPKTPQPDETEALRQRIKDLEGRVAAQEDALRLYRKYEGFSTENAPGSTTAAPSEQLDNE